MEFGSVKNKIVHPYLIEEWKRLDFDQEELAILLFVTKERYDMRNTLNKIAAEDEILKNGPHLYGLSREEIFEWQIKWTKRLADILPTLPVKKKLEHFNELYV